VSTLSQKINFGMVSQVAVCVFLLVGIGICRGQDGTSLCWTEALEAVEAIRAGNENPAQEFLTRYASDPDFGKGVRRIADAYCRQKEFVKANAYYAHAAGILPPEDYAIHEWKYKALSAMYSEKVDLLEESINALLTYTQNGEAAYAAHHLADVCRRANFTEESHKLEEFVTKNYPEHEFAIWAQRGLIQSCIALRQWDRAEQEYQTLLARYSDREGLALCVTWVGNSYCKEHEYDKARAAYQYVLDHWPADPTALEALENAIKIDIVQGRSDAAEAGTAQLLGEGTSEDRAKMLYQIGTVWQWSLNLSEAKESFERIERDWPGSKYAKQAAIHLLLLHIGEGNQEADESAITAFLTCYGNEPESVYLVFSMGVGYFQQGLRKAGGTLDKATKLYFEKAIPLFLLVAERAPEHRISPESELCLADCFRMLEKLEQAAEYYQKTVDRWPGYSLSWNAQFRAGQCYEKMKQKKLFPEADADAKIRHAYEKVMLNYPQCPAVQAVQTWLAAHPAM